MGRMVGWDDMAPRPRSLDEANAEVLRLRIALAVANKKWGESWAKAQLDKKAMAGQLEYLRTKVIQLQNLLGGVKDPKQ